MAYYNICHLCGAHLDPGERCNCEQEKLAAMEKKKKTYNQIILRESSGQYRFTDRVV